MRREAVCIAVVALCANGCAPHADDAPPTTPSTTQPGLRIVADPTLGAHLEAEGLGGVIAILDGTSDEVRCSDVEACAVRSAPASTFKIVNALIALETSVAPDAGLVIPWDGIQREFPDWNRDHTLSSAFAASSVPYYQELARRIGLARMDEYVRRFRYGNARIGAVVDTFWLEGPLEISPIEQLDFLRRFDTGALPISERTRTIMRDVMVRERRGESVLRGKTGWSARTPELERGWFVGYAEHEGRTTYVAVRALRDPGMSADDFFPRRPRAAIRALEAIGAY